MKKKKKIEKAKFTYSPFGKAFEKQIKTIEKQGEKIDTIRNQTQRLETLANRNIYKEIFNKIVKGKFDDIKELTNEINHDYLTCYFKGDTAKKTFDDFNNGVALFLKKIQSG